MINTTYKYYIPIILLIVSAFILLQSPLAPFANKMVYNDSAIYIYSAKEILKGKLMYKEIFDHKGPMLYVINIIGLWILKGNLTGIWLVELFFLFITSLYIFKTARFFVDDKVAVISSIYLLFTLPPLISHGNIPEEYALPFMAVSGYILTGYITKQRVMKYLDVLLVSVCFSMTFLLRPNLVPLWTGFAVVILFSLIRERKYKDIFTYSSLVITGVVLTVLPFLLYALKNKILSDAIFCIWKFNMAYSNHTLTKIMQAAYKSTEDINKTYLTMLLLIYVWYLVLNFKREGNKLLHAVVIINIVLTMFISCGFGWFFVHYAVAYVPVVCVAVVLCFSIIAKYGKGIIFPLGVMLILTFQALVVQYTSIVDAYVPKPGISSVTNFIKDATKEGDTIAIVGNDSRFYFMSGRSSCSKYHYLNPLLDVAAYNSLIRGEFCADLIKNKPKLIVVHTQYGMSGCIAEIIGKDYNPSTQLRNGSMVIYLLK
ncbi:glycosyltransferase family 39 protein [Candidatus Magnetomonas plexicatena]|uniref:glycosyltransferase family 39 protein n=1 Tax=Candidatus Magnetomonas plexicatena TaxID=2552947 RepID=UPI001C791FA4|nr:hypothetical protein E2O03_001820 [Nitrospirales bacterium LBB_01]